MNMSHGSVQYHFNFYSLDGLYKLTINIFHFINVKNVVPIPKMMVKMGNAQVQL